MAGIDVWDKPLLRSRPWLWLKTHIEGLLSRPPAFDMSGQPHFTTRIQSELWQPPEPAAVPDHG